MNQCHEKHRSPTGTRRKRGHSRHGREGISYPSARRRAGRAPGYDYSPAVKNSKITWNEKTLDRWLAGPEGLIPGQKMGVSVSEAKDRADLIEYLKEESRR